MTRANSISHNARFSRWKSRSGTLDRLPGKSRSGTFCHICHRSPIFRPLIVLGLDRKVLRYSYRADTPIPTTLVAIPEQKKILVACLFKPLCPPQSQPAKWWFLNRYWKIRSVAKISVLIIFNLQGVYCPQFFLFNGNHLSKKVIKR